MLPSMKIIAVIFFGLLVFATAQLQLDDELDFGQGGLGLGGGLTDSTGGQQHYNLQHFNFPSAATGSFEGLGGSSLLGIPSTESITQLGQAIAEGGVPSGTHGEIATPTAQPPPQGQERRVGIAQRLISAGFLNRRRR